MNAETFLIYVQEHLAPNLRAGDIVVMDNLASHKAPGVKEYLRGPGART